MSDQIITQIPAFNPTETYASTATAALIRGSDGACIPADPANSDYRAFLAWQASGKTPTPYAPPPAPIPSCQLWQLQASMTADQWTAAQNVVAASGNQAAIAFFSHPGATIPANSATLLQLTKAAGIVATQADLTALVAKASEIAIP